MDGERRTECISQEEEEEWAREDGTVEVKSFVCLDTQRVTLADFQPLFSCTLITVLL